MKGLFLMVLFFWFLCKYVMPMVQTKAMKEKSEERIERLAKVGKVAAKVGGTIVKRWLK